MKIKIKLFVTVLVSASLFIGAFASDRAFAVVNVDFRGVTNIPIKREVNNVSNPVTNTFGYAITPDANNPIGATNLPSSATIQFDAVAPAANHTATFTGSIDFSGVSFTRPGDYYFTVKEVSSSDPDNYPIDSTTYTAIASVRFNSDMDTLLVTLVQKMENNTGDKVDAVWVSESPRTYFEISTSTIGNVADLGLCFEYIINVPTSNGITASDSFAVSTSSTCLGNPAQIVAGADTIIKLKDGDTITVGSLNGTVSQIPIGSGYNITLNDAYGYEATFNGTTMMAGVVRTVSGLVAVDDSGFESTNEANIVLRKDTDVYTGIMNNIWTYVVILIIGVTGAVIAVNQARRRRQ